ncbi:hypothetical protein BKA80DRAFT_327801, partial [Phyllosticta citrichinensis]
WRLLDDTLVPRGSKCFAVRVRPSSRHGKLSKMEFLAIGLDLVRRRHQSPKSHLNRIDQQPGFASRLFLYPPAYCIRLPCLVINPVLSKLPLSPPRLAIAQVPTLRPQIYLISWFHHWAALYHRLLGGIKYQRPTLEGSKANSCAGFAPLDTMLIAVPKTDRSPHSPRSAMQMSGDGPAWRFGPPCMMS